MKIKKIDPQEISDKKLHYKDYRKILKPALKKMISEHNSTETATRFIVKTDFEFADMKGKRMGLVIPGNHTSTWLKMAKEQVKEDKKHTCIGDCYVRSNANGSFTLVLNPEKGAAKKNLMIKQLEKFALKGTPFTIEVTSGGELEEDSEADAIVEDIALPADDSEDEEDDDLEEETASVTANTVSDAELKTMTKEIVSKFKLLQNDYARDAAIEILGTIKDWASALSVASESLKIDLKEAAATIQKIEQYLRKLIQIDNAIDKELSPIYSLIDNHNTLVERGDIAATPLKEKILQSFEKIAKYAAEIKDSSLVSVLDDFKRKLK